MKIVFPRGRMLDSAVKLMREAIPELSIKNNRELVHTNGKYQILLAKPTDVPTYVREGGDLGVTGRDVVRERSPDVFIPLSLPFGECRISVARMRDDPTPPEEMEGYRIATEYPSITREYFLSLDVPVEIIVLDGSTELAPRAGIADAVVDVVQTGNTLRANGLVEAGKIMESSALLLVNRIAQKTKFEQINALIYSIREVIRDEA